MGATIGVVYVEPNGKSVVVNITSAAGGAVTAYTARDGSSTHSFPQTITTRTGYFYDIGYGLLVSCKRNGVEVATSAGAAAAVSVGRASIGVGATVTPIYDARLEQYVSALGVSVSPSTGIGYATGAGGAVTQVTTRATGVTLNTIAGQITTDTTSLAAGGEAEFTVTNSAVAATDVVIVNLTPGGTGTPFAYVSSVAAGAFKITISNLHASTADTSADVINFAVIKAVAA